MEGETERHERLERTYMNAHDTQGREPGRKRERKRETKHNDMTKTHRGRGSDMHRNLNTGDKTDSHRRHRLNKRA